MRDSARYERGWTDVANPPVVPPKCVTVDASLERNDPTRPKKPIAPWGLEGNAIHMWKSSQSEYPERWFGS